MKKILQFNVINFLKKTFYTLLEIFGAPITALLIQSLRLVIVITHLIKTSINRFKGIFKNNKTSKVSKRWYVNFFITPINFFLKTIALLSIVVIILGITTAIGLFIYIKNTDLPSPYRLNNHQPPQTSHLYDRHGQLLYSMYQQENRSIAKLNDLPYHVIQAHLAIEDDDFYNHMGVSLPDIARAAIHNLKREYCLLESDNCPQILQGGSTITQQLIKNTLLTSERTWTRKLQEAYLAYQIEQTYSKDQILEMYLNQIPYGGTAYGIEAASQMYFNKPITDLTLAEAALLAGLPAAPSSYSPFGGDPHKAINRQHMVLNRMFEEQYITYDQLQEAKQQTLSYASPSTDINAPHFVMYTRDLLEQTLGPENIYQGGLEIYTSLDLELQKFTEQALRQELEYLSSLNVTNGAILVTRPRTGEILAMVGSKNYFDTTNQGNVNATLAPRQPGSSIKPLTYATAFSLSNPSQFNSPDNIHFTAASLIDDAPIVYKIPGSPDYKPKNYDGKFHGKVSLRQALASSYNIPAVKILNMIGVDSLIQMGQNLGITTWDDPSRFGLALTLGAGEVRMVDMAVVYGTFANLGQKQNLNPILQIKNITGKYLPQESPPSPFQDQTHELAPQAAFIINNILSDNQARSSAFGTFSKLDIPGHTVAVKTGTSNDLRDNWAIGYTPEYLVAVWVGNFDNAPMSRIASGITGATPIWNKIMSHLLNEYHPKQHPFEGQYANTWQSPDNMIKIPICIRTGTLACEKCQTREEWFIKGTEPTTSCRPDFFAQPPITPPSNS